MRAGLTLYFAIFTFAAARAQTTLPESGKQPVVIREIRILGSRLPQISLLHLTGFRAGQTVDEAKVRAGIEHANASGLFKNISYTYESEPGSTDVILALQVEDQLPLVPVTIKIPGVPEQEAWAFLQKADPLFTHEAPTTANAIDLYARYLTKYLASLGREDIVIGRVLGSVNPTGIELIPGKLHSVTR